VQLNERLRYAHLPPPDSALLSSPALFVELERRPVLPMLKKRFASVTPLGALLRTYRGQTLARYAIYRLADPLGPVLEGEEHGPAERP
jgi:hypothetical protein